MSEMGKSKKTIKYFVVVSLVSGTKERTGPMSFDMAESIFRAELLKHKSTGNTVLRYSEYS